LQSKDEGPIYLEDILSLSLIILDSW